MKSEVRMYIADMVEYMQRVIDDTKSVDEAEFSFDKLLQDGILRRIEVIGEIAKRIPQNIKDKYKQIPWKEMSGIRDVIAHDYDGVDLEIVWKICTIRIPEIKPQIETILGEMKDLDQDSRS